MSKNKDLESEKQLWPRLPTDLVFSLFGFFLQQEKCLVRTVCRPWYECSKLCRAQKALWRYPIRLCFRHSQKFDGALDSLTMSSNTLYLVTETAKTIRVLSVQGLSSTKRKRESLSPKYKEVKFGEIGGEGQEYWHGMRHIAADGHSGLVAHQNGDYVNILDFHEIAAPVIKVFTFPEGSDYMCALYQRLLFVVFHDHLDIYEMDGTLVRSWSFRISMHCCLPHVSIFEKKIYSLYRQHNPPHDILRFKILLSMTLVCMCRMMLMIKSPSLRMREFLFRVWGFILAEEVYIRTTLH
jgi:hypothetical protein